MNIMETIPSHPFSSARQNIRTLLVDFLILAGIYGMVSFAHIIPFPLYKLEPMKLFLLIAIVYSSRGNALLMAATIPLVSFLTSGHPVYPKNIIIGIELMVFAGLLSSSHVENYGRGVRFLSALLLSKFQYYLVKGLVIYTGMLEMTLFSTPFLVQLQGAVMVFATYWILISAQSRWGKEA